MFNVPKQHETDTANAMVKFLVTLTEMEGLPNQSALNGVVMEYLEMLDLNKTMGAFDEELKERHMQVDTTQLPAAEDQSQSKIQYAMMEAFDSGNCQGFFRLWNKHLPEEMYQNDNDCRRLEFRISLYFAVYPFFDASWGKSSCPSPEMALKIFKNYLETRGQSLSQTTEFVVFYALPFVPQPRNHPSFKILFEPSWTQELKSHLEAFLSATFCTKPFPYLYRIYTGVAEKSMQDKQQNVAQINALQQQVGLLESRASQYLKKYTKIQEDYHNLLGIAAELVDSLENSVRGKMVSPDYLQGVCERLFSNAESNPSYSMDFTRPGTAASVLRASIANASVGNSLSQDTPFYPSLNYDKIKANLKTVTARKQALLLQALRWRLTKAQSSEQMEAVISSYIANDIAGCSMDPKHMKTIVGMMSSDDEIVREYVARFVNTIASFTQGRTYLSESRSMVVDMFQALKTEHKESSTSENLLGAMQKVSMRREVQSTMIQQGVVEWLLMALDELDSLSDYSLEYSVALLMNLCLRSSGKKRCLNRGERTLKLLTDLMGHENQEIRPYLNGALYSILSLPTIRQKASAMGLEEMLRCFFQESQPEMNRQLQFIINKINTADPNEVDDPFSDDEEEEEDEDEEGDAVDPELDRDEPLVARKGELSGESLLAEEYLAVLPSSSSLNAKGKKKVPSTNASLGKDLDKPISRPVTPASRVSLTSIKESESERSLPAATKELERPRTQSSKSARRSPNGDQQQKSEERGSRMSPKPESARSQVGTKQYGDVFASRPKIPRSPELSARSESRPGSAKPGSARSGVGRPATGSRPGTASPPPLVRSTSPTRASRPSSKTEGRPISSSSQKLRGKKTQ